MTEDGSSRKLEFDTFRLGEPVRITEHTGYGSDRVQARIGPYQVWMTDNYRVVVADHRIEDERERMASATTYTIAEAARVAGALMQDRPDYCTAENLTEHDRVVALWAGAYLLIEGSRYIAIDGYAPPRTDN